MQQRYLRHYLGVGDESVLYLVRLTGTNFKVSQRDGDWVFYINFASNVSQSECLTSILS